MPVRVLRFEPTPNPLALKCVVDQPVGPGGEAAARSFRRGLQRPGAGHPLADRLLALPGVEGVLFGPGGAAEGGAWVTISKSAQADWKAVKSGVERVLAEA
jgi:hypothetical protein